MIAAAEQTFGGLHVLFNNAGIMDSRDDDAVSTDTEVWDLTMNVNAKGVFLGCKYGIPALRRAGGGSIIIRPRSWRFSAPPRHRSPTPRARARFWR